MRHSSASTVFGIHNAVFTLIKHGDRFNCISLVAFVFFTFIIHSPPPPPHIFLARYFFDFNTRQKASFQQLYVHRAVSGVTFLLSRYQISDDADEHPISVQSRNETNEIPVRKLRRKKFRPLFSLT
jgi:hypothetical protein